MITKFYGGARDGARENLPEHLSYRGARVVLPVTTPVEQWFDGIVPELNLELAEYYVLGIHEPPAGERFILARAREALE